MAIESEVFGSCVGEKDVWVEMKIVRGGFAVGENI
jgi:hypothetical protein